MRPESARLLDEVATEASRARAAALIQLQALERFLHTPQHRALLGAAADQPFEGMA